MLLATTNLPSPIGHSSNCLLPKRTAWALSIPHHPTRHWHHASACLSSTRLLWQCQPTRNSLSWTPPDSSWQAHGIRPGRTNPAQQPDLNLPGDNSRTSLSHPYQDKLSSTSPEPPDSTSRNQSFIAPRILINYLINASFMKMPETLSLPTTNSTFFYRSLSNNDTFNGFAFTSTLWLT